MPYERQSVTCAVKAFDVEWECSADLRSILSEWSVRMKVEVVVRAGKQSLQLLWSCASQGDGSHMYCVHTVDRDPM